MFPSLTFYWKLVWIVYFAAQKAQKGAYNWVDWVDSSWDVMKALESVGVQIDISGIENLKQVEKPVVFIGNHMSMMETVILPMMICPVKPVTFVIKESLLEYPVFKHVMRSRDPIAVTRNNPRQDLKLVLSEGVDRLSKGISVVVFPQTTRANQFSPEQMSSIGVKLAKKADVPIIPIALKTDCWGNGKLIKDLGRFDLSKTAYFSFGEPLVVAGKGEEEQEKIGSFIVKSLANWTA
jgi:1-acyl-sn-glycerol-3-phosphate acyltransferase